MEQPATQILQYTSHVCSPESLLLFRNRSRSLSCCPLEKEHLDIQPASNYLESSCTGIAGTCVGLSRHHSSRVFSVRDCSAKNFESVLTFTDCWKMIFVCFAVRVSIVKHCVNEFLLINLDHHNSIFNPQAVAAAYSESAISAGLNWSHLH